MRDDRPAALPSPRQIERLVALVEGELAARPPLTTRPHAACPAGCIQPSSLEWAWRLLHDLTEARHMAAPLLHDLLACLNCWLVPPRDLDLSACRALWASVAFAAGQSAADNLRQSGRIGPSDREALGRLTAILLGREADPAELESCLHTIRPYGQKSRVA
ncbi:hypothetical protein [Paracoccus sp. PAR01]|uniref:hypothetical protein n=1 Tax=Paracoccus sp. PAR01 TaxID=2769282 RepID=UPI001783352F|nr:hypothetical protein [Paracoccus sp. PAR01]MBD9527835.1 hypothetical protein [Paracoccus sp. PAR01]